MANRRKFGREGGEKQGGGRKVKMAVSPFFHAKHLSFFGCYSTSDDMDGLRRRRIPSELCVELIVVMMSAEFSLQNRTSSI